MTFYFESWLGEVDKKLHYIGLNIRMVDIKIRSFSILRICGVIKSEKAIKIILEMFEVFWLILRSHLVSSVVKDASIIINISILYVRYQFCHSKDIYLELIYAFCKKKKTMKLTNIYI